MIDGHASVEEYRGDTCTQSMRRDLLLNPCLVGSLSHHELNLSGRVFVAPVALEKIATATASEVCLQLLREGSVSTVAVPVAGPHGLALDEEASQLYVACDSGDLVVLDRASSAIQASVAIAGEPDVIWLNNRCRRLYVAIGNPGILQAIDLQRMQIAEEVQTEEGAKTFAFDEQRQRLYLFLPKSCHAVVYDEA